MTAGTQRYTFHGLVVESELPLDAPASDRSPDLRVAMGETAAEPERAPSGRVLSERHLGQFDAWLVEDPEQAGVWRFRYAGHCDVVFDHADQTITAHPHGETDHGLISLLITGSVISHILSARGHVLLHAAAVESAGRVLAIAGQSGAGKSTLAALLCASGARLVTDDALRVELDGGAPACLPGTRVLRLREQAAELATAVPGGGGHRTADDRLGLNPPTSDGAALSLAAILAPRPSRDAHELTVERLAGREALVELLRCPRIGGWVTPGPIASYFDSAAKLIEQVAVYRAVIPWGPPFKPGLSGDLLAAVELPDAPRS